MFTIFFAFSALALVSASAHRFEIRSDAVSGLPAPPQPPLEWNHTPADVVRQTKDALAQFKARHAQIARLSAADRNFSSVGAIRVRLAADAHRPR